MSDTIFNLLFPSLIFWSCFLLCDLSLKRTSSGLYVYLIIIGIYLIDCALFYFTAFSSLPYAWYLFALFPILVLPLLYRNQLPIIIFTYMSSLLFTFMIQITMKIVTYILYFNYPALYVQIDSSFILMIALCVYIVLIPALLRFAFEKIAKHSSSRSMLLTWLCPVIALAVLMYNDYFDLLYTVTTTRYMISLLIVIIVIYIIFYMILTSARPAVANIPSPPRAHLERPIPNVSKKDLLQQCEKQYFESIINSYNDTLDHAFVTEKGLQSIQRMIHENNIDDALRILNQLHDSLNNIQLLHITGKTTIDTLLSYYQYLFLQDSLRLNLQIDYPQNSKLHDLDFCILFGSLLQNAYDILYNCQIDQGEVLLECKVEGRILHVTCANIFDGDNKQIQRTSSSFSLACINDLCKHHKGNVELYSENTIFNVYVDLEI